MRDVNVQSKPSQADGVLDGSVNGNAGRDSDDQSDASLGMEHESLEVLNYGI